MITLNEHSGRRLTARFYEDGVAYTPTTVHWRVDCVTTGNEVQGWTEASAEEEVDELGIVTAVKVDIQIPGSINVMQQTQQKTERKVLLIVANMDLADEHSAEYEYEIRDTLGRD